MNFSQRCQVMRNVLRLHIDRLKLIIYSHFTWWLRYLTQLSWALLLASCSTNACRCTRQLWEMQVYKIRDVIFLFACKVCIVCAPSCYFGGSGSVYERTHAVTARLRPLPPQHRLSDPHRLIPNRAAHNGSAAGSPRPLQTVGESHHTTAAALRTHSGGGSGGRGGAIHHLSSVLFQTEWERTPLTISRAKLLFTSREPCPLRRPSRRVVRSLGVRVLSWGQIKSWRADMAATPGSSPLYVSTCKKRWFSWFSLRKRQKNTKKKAPHAFPLFAPRRNIFSSVFQLSVLFCLNPYFVSQSEP